MPPVDEVAGCAAAVFRRALVIVLVIFVVWFTLLAVALVFQGQYLSAAMCAALAAWFLWLALQP